MAHHKTRVQYALIACGLAGGTRHGRPGALVSVNGKRVGRVGGRPQQQVKARRILACVHASSIAALCLGLLCAAVGHVMAEAWP